MGGEISVLLRRLRAGDPEAESELFTAVYSELKRLARSRMRSFRRDHTIPPTALVNEAYLKLAGEKDAEWQDRAHFFRVASRIMRQVLVDHARARAAEKRGGRVQILAFDDELERPDRPGDSAIVDVIMLDDALERLRKIDPRVHEVVELRCFGGCSVDETAKTLGVSPRTVKRDWRLGRAWLRGELQPLGSGDATSLVES